VVVERVEVGREVLHAGAQRAALPGGRLEQQPGCGVTGGQGVEQGEQALAHLPHGARVPSEAVALARVDVRPGVHDDALGADLRRPLEVVRHRRHRALVRRGRRRAEVHQVRRVDEDPGAALGHQVAEARVLGRLALTERPATRVAREDLERLAAHQVGVGHRPVDQPLADQHVGPDRIAEDGIEHPHNLDERRSRPR